MSRIKITRRRFLQCALAGGVSATLVNLTKAFAQVGAPTSIAGSTESGRMDQGQPSLTAQGAAILRAAHQIIDAPRILDDPIALRIIGRHAESALRSNPDQYDTRRILRAFVVLRSRYAEDELARAIRRGVRQYVILGAGLDTFPYRNPYPVSQLRVFEVDHPATQSWKRERLQEAGISIPESLTFTPVDFERQTLAEGLSRAGFRADEAAFFSLLGVVIYLTKQAIMETLKFVVSLPSGSEIVLDYAIPSSSLTEEQRTAREAEAKRVAAIGEPWITYFDPSSLARELHQMGFKHVEDFGPEDANNRYFKDRTDGLRVSGSAHLMKASR